MARNIEVTLELDNRQYNRAIRQSSAQTQKFTNDAKSGISGLGSAIAALGGATILRSITQVGGSFQDLSNSLNVVFGSVEAGAAAFERVQTFAAGTQFSVQQLTQAFIQLKGAGVEPTEELLQTFADTASVTTDQMGTFQAALDLVSRSTAGGLGLEDLNRLADRGIPVFRILQERLGLARLEISEFGKTSEGARQIIDSLLAGLRQDFGGALATQVGNINFELNQLGDAFDKLQNAIFQTFSTEASGAITALADAINRLADNTEGINSLMKALLGVGIALGSLGALRVITRLMNGLQAGITGVIGVIAGGGGLARIIGTFTNNLGGLLGVSGRIVDVFKGSGPLARAMASVGQIIFSVAGKFSGLLRILLRFAGPAGVLFAIFEGFKFIKSIFFDTAEEADGVTEAVDGMTGAMRRNAEAQAEFEARQRASAEALAAAQAAFNAEFAPTIELAKEFAKVDYRTQLEQLTDRVNVAKETIFNLRMAFVAANGDIENYSELIEASKNELEAAEAALQKYNDGLKDPAPQTYKEFLVELLESTRDYSNQQENARKALEFLNTEMVKGALTTEEYNFALERLNSILGITEEKVPTEAFDAFNELLEDIAKNTENYNLMIERLNQLYTEGALTAEQYAEAKRNLDNAFTENEGVDSFLETLGRAQVALSTDLADAFLNGKSALDSFKNFFKKIVSQIIADIIRLQIIQPILGSLLAPFGFGFGTGGSVIRLPGKAMGGPVSKDSAYIVGERGPEVFVPNSSGSIIPNNRLGTQVTYNINAVDALSFKQMVARDPEFIYSVTQRGARSLPA
jgi:hypothetical protein